MGREQYTLTAQNEKYWHAAAFYSFPCILAYEYKKLQNLLLEQDGLGSLLKLKDIFEVLLKFRRILFYAVPLKAQQGKLRTIK